MPAITASLSETGYDGYKSIPKGNRSRVIDKLLQEYALNRFKIRYGSPGNYTEPTGKTGTQLLKDNTFLEEALIAADETIERLQKEAKQ
jgi:hypothetical protein